VPLASSLLIRRRHEATLALSPRGYLPRSRGTAPRTVRLLLRSPSGAVFESLSHDETAAVVVVAVAAAAAAAAAAAS